jgi:hypothetical protein
MLIDNNIIVFKLLQFFSFCYRKLSYIMVRFIFVQVCFLMFTNFFKYCYIKV